ncbi:MAG: hypothetical protein ACREP5_01195, partial [Candidatus Binatia bacterium]
VVAGTADEAAGIKNALWANSVDDFARAVAGAMEGSQLCFIGAKVTTERTDVPPYPFDEVENKYRFMRHIEKSESIEIFKTNLPASYR